MGNLVNQAQIKYRSAIESAQANIDRIQLQIKGLDNQIASLNGEIQVLNNQYTESMKLVADHQSKWDRRYNCGGFKEPCNNHLDRRDAEQKKANAYKVSITTKEAQVQSLISQKAGLNTQLVSATDTLRGLQAESDRAIAEATAQELSATNMQIQQQNATNPAYLAQQAAIETARINAEKEKALEIERQKVLATVEVQKAEAKKEESKSNMIMIIVAAVMLLIMAGAGFFLLKK